MNLVVTGEVGCGKTTWCARYLDRLTGHGVSAGGILCLAVFEVGTKTGYDVKDLRTGKTAVFARINPLEGFPGKMVGKYLISDDGLAFAQQAIWEAVETSCDVVFIDEMGHLELIGRGLADSAKDAYNRAFNTVSVVRKTLLPAFLCSFASATGTRFSIRDIGMDAAGASIDLIPAGEPLTTRYK